MDETATPVINEIQPQEVNNVDQPLVIAGEGGTQDAAENQGLSPEEQVEDKKSDESSLCQKCAGTGLDADRANLCSECNGSGGRE